MKNRLISFMSLVLLTFLASCSNENGKAAFEKANDTIPLVFDNFEEGNGFEVLSLEHKRYIQLASDIKEGNLQEYLFDNSARYDVTLFFIDEPLGKSKIDLLINGRNTGSFSFDIGEKERRKAKQVTIPDVDIQKWSRIDLEFHRDGTENCRVEKLVLKPKGKFQGEKEKLTRPVSPEVFVTASERLRARKIFEDYVDSHTDSAAKKRLAELKKLKTPQEWKARQDWTRMHLPLFVGEFPDKTPLNPKVVGTIDRKLYKIEKVIYESQPQYYVTANFYVPKNRKMPVPGVLFTSGHSADAKAATLYHEACLGLVLKGYAVLAFDPMGQGERSEYINPETHENTVGFNVSQHHYIGKPSFLVNWSLAGLRIWDGIRSLDYLESRPEVDREKLAVMGNSGGGEMTMLITAVDERVKVCVASHPGGSMEETYLGGGQLINREIFSLIPPRPCRINVGRDSGEENGHRKKIEDMQLFYEGLEVSKDLGELVLVDGVHDMKKPKREASYEWLNKWFGKEEEGTEEALLDPEKVENLWCTKEGNVLLSFGGETGQTMNSKRAGKIYNPEQDPEVLKNRIARRTGISYPVSLKVPDVHRVEKIKLEKMTVEKFTYESEKGITVPAFLIQPIHPDKDAAVYIYVSEKGKPRSFGTPSMPFSLVNDGSIVMAIDVRGTGETSMTPSLKSDKFTGYDVLQWKNDVLASRCPEFGKTTLGMRTEDITTAVNYIKSRKDLKNRRIIVAGEGLGGLWALLSAIYDIRVNGVVTENTLTSYMQLVRKQYYNLQNYFWVPGALVDFDIPDLANLVSPKPQIWIHPVNGMNEEVNYAEALASLGSPENMKIITPEEKKDKEAMKLISEAQVNYYEGESKGTSSP